MPHKPEIVGVPLNLLIIDSRVQRPLDQRKADKIAADLNLDAIGLICLSHRDDGAYSIIDGQHRVAGLRIAGFADDAVDCEVFRGLTLADEAAMFRLRNNRSAVQRVDLFRVRVIEGDPDATAVHDLLARHGWTVEINTADGKIAAIAALEHVYSLDKTGDPTAAERTIVTITAAWGHASSGVEAPIIAGLGALYLRYADAVESASVIDRLGRYPGGAKALVGKAKGLRELIGGKVGSAVAEIVVEEYNRRRRTSGLPPWRAS
jgi:hypothetical protein